MALIQLIRKRPIASSSILRNISSYYNYSTNLNAMSSTQAIDSLFPKPSSSLSRVAPAHWPGISPQSTNSLLQVLKDNHEKWHVFFNEKQFHNHAPHRALALWVLGANGSVIEAGYEKDCGYEKSAFKSPEEITEDNFAKHLGDERFYNAYLLFFQENVAKKGIEASIEEYIFSKKANFGSAQNTPKKDRPQMLSRFLSGVVHPMIHTGYGAEFGLPGIVAEGLAQTAVHQASATQLIPASLFYGDTETTIEESSLASAQKLVKSLTDSLDAAMSIDPTSSAKPVISSLSDSTKAGPHSRAESSKSGNVHALSILGRILSDEQFSSGGDNNEMAMFMSTIRKHGSAIVGYVNQWTINLSEAGEIEKKMEELVWMNVLIYGVGGWTGRGKELFNADFFFMHLVTSSLFLPSLLAVIPLNSKAILLQSYLAMSLTWYVARGRPALDIAGFFSDANVNMHPEPAGPRPTPSEGALTPEDKTPNSWLPIIQTSIVHPDEHVPKLQRALAHWAGLYGAADKGGEIADTDLPGAGDVDGTLFLRAAGLTVKRMGWVREGEHKADFWDRTGFYGNP